MSGLWLGRGRGIWWVLVRRIGRLNRPSKRELVLLMGVGFLQMCETHLLAGCTEDGNRLLSIRHRCGRLVQG
jgi:hypothetical protein